MTDLGLKYKAVAEAFLSSAHSAGFNMPLQFQCTHPSKLPVPSGMRAVSGVHVTADDPAESTEPVPFADRTVLTANQVLRAWL